MSVMFLPPPSASSIPDASETVSGKIRIATSAEATAGTNDLTAMTPAKTKSVVDAAVVGGVTYQGTFDASAPADLSNAEKGDLYIISVAGTYQGQTWAVGDHLLINADMGGTLDPAKIDKVDNTDSVTSVAGRTGAVTLSTADISGLATVASTGAYSDLTGAPTLATVATTGAYSDLTGTPTLGTAAAEDVGTLAGNVVQLDGTAKLPAVDGSQLTNLPSAPVTSVAGKTGAVTLVAGDISGLATVATTGAYSDLTGTPTLATVATTGAYSDLSGTPSLATVATTGAYSDLTGTPTLGTAAAEDVGTLAGNVVQLDGTAKLPAVDGSQLTNLPSAPVTSVAGKTGAVTLVAGDISGLATVATTGAYSDLTGTPTLGTAAAEDVGTLAGNVVQLDGSARLPAVDGSQLTNLPSGASTLGALTDVTLTSAADGQFLKYDSISGDWVNGNSGLYEAYTFTTTGTVATPDQPKTIAARLSSSTAQTLTLPTGSSDLLGSTISLTNINTGAWTISAAAGQYIRGLSSAPTLTQDQALILTLVFDSVWYVVAYEEQGLGSLADVDVTGAVATNVLKYDGTDWVDGAVAYSEVTGTPTLATVATTGAYSDLTGTPTLATVATTGAYSDLTGTPTLGTAAAEDVGTLAGNVVQLDGTAKLPAVDGSQLTNLPSAPVTSVAGKTGAVTLVIDDMTDVDTTTATPSTGDLLEWNGSNWVPVARFEVVTTITTSSSLTVPEHEQLVRTSGSGITLTLPNIASNSIAAGVRYQIKVTDSNTVTVTPNGTELLEGVNSSYTTGGAKEALTVLCDGSGWWFV